MAHTGRIPRVANPAAKVTAVAFGDADVEEPGWMGLGKRAGSVPLGIAAVIATTSVRSVPSSVTCANTAVYVALLVDTDRCLPVAGSCPGRERVPTSRHAHPRGNPSPSGVMKCTSRGPFRSRTAISVSSNASMSWPSIGPKYRNPNSSKSTPGREERLDALFPFAHEGADPGQPPGRVIHGRADRGPTRL